MTSLFAKAFERADVVSLFVTIIALVALSLSVDADTLKAWVIEAGIWAPLAFVVVKVLTIVIAPLSGGALYPLAGLLFGLVPGILLIAVGDFIGYSTSFWISRRFGRPVVLKFLSDKEESILPKIIEYAATTRGMLHLCFTFFSMSEVISYGAGLGTIRYAKFISILLPFSMAGASLLVAFGAALDARGGSLGFIMLIPLFSLIAGGVGFAVFLKRTKTRQRLGQ